MVLCIVGMGWFTLLPKLNMSNREADTRKALDLFLEKIRDEAVTSYEAQEVSFTLGERKLKWAPTNATRPQDEEPDYVEVELESNVARCMINGLKPPELDIRFHVYPGGFMDGVELEMSSGQVLVSSPLQTRMELLDLEELDETRQEAMRQAERADRGRLDDNSELSSPPVTFEATP